MHGNYTMNMQNTGRELMTPDEVRMLDNKFALLFIRGERPVKDLKYDILKHPNLKFTSDGGEDAYRHGEVTADVASIIVVDFDVEPAIVEDVIDSGYELLSEADILERIERGESGNE